tara:strand:- start:605 stop:865 length:261 start_codon:yes stop_codon:yes gene_type:complete
MIKFDDMELPRWKMTLDLLQSKFCSGDQFVWDDVHSIVHPFRSKISSFKSKSSFKGAILRELQVLRDLNYIKFHAKEGRPGVYSLV